jgi:hypothetical protein
MSALAKLSVLFASLLIASLALGKDLVTHAQKIAALIDPAKLSTLAPRGANPRVQKYVAQLFEAKQAGLDPVRCAAEAAAELLAVGAAPPEPKLDAIAHAALSAVCLGILNLDEALTRE